MTLRIVMAGLVGGLAMFAFIATMHFSPLSLSGVQTMPREGLITETLASGVGGSGGFYAFPADPGAPETRASGLLVFNIANVRMNTPPRFAAELAKDVVQALFLAMLLALSRPARFWPRLGLAGIAGALVALTVNGSHAIWFGFPLSYVLPQGAIVLVSYLLAGAVIALLLPRISTDRT